jgi:hypothetical protein
VTAGAASLRDLAPRAAQGPVVSGLAGPGDDDDDEDDETPIGDPPDDDEDGDWDEDEDDDEEPLQAVACCVATSPRRRHRGTIAAVSRSPPRGTMSYTRLRA